MPNFVFELTAKRYFYSASSDHSSQGGKLTFKAETISSCDIQIKDKGTLKIGDATFYESNDSDAAKALGTISYVEDFDDSHTFSIFAYLPQPTLLLLLNTNPEQASVYLTFTTNLEALQAGESGVTYGHGQGDVVWDVEKEQRVIAESITIGVIFHATSLKNTNGQTSSNSASSQQEERNAALTSLTERIGQLIECIAPNDQALLGSQIDTTHNFQSHEHRDLRGKKDCASVAPDISKLTRPLDRLFWAIIIVGGLLLFDLLLRRLH